MTVTAFASVSIDPPTVLVSLRSEATSARAISDTRSFGVSILAADQLPVARYGSAPGRRSSSSRSPNPAPGRVRARSLRERSPTSIANSRKPSSRRPLRPLRPHSGGTRLPRRDAAPLPPPRLPDAPRPRQDTDRLEGKSDAGLSCRPRRGRRRLVASTATVPANARFPDLARSRCSATPSRYDSEAETACDARDSAAQRESSRLRRTARGRALRRRGARHCRHPGSAADLRASQGARLCVDDRDALARLCASRVPGAARPEPLRASTEGGREALNASTHSAPPSFCCRRSAPGAGRPWPTLPTSCLLSPPSSLARGAEPPCARR